MEDVLVIGSGPAGLATAAELLVRGIATTVLERGDRSAAAWAGRYDDLRFNTSRWWSALPGAPFPREFGWFPTRDQYVDYLDGYAARSHVPVRTGVEVTRIDRLDGAWSVRTRRDTLTARHVVVATGVQNQPLRPGWAGAADYRGTLVHSASFRNAGAYRDRRVLVAGAGSSGLEIAHLLVCGGAREVLLSVRTPPNLLLRASGGLPADLPVPLFMRLPVPMVDAMLRALQRVTVGDLTSYGLPPSHEGVVSSLKARGAGTAIIDQEVVDEIKDGSIRVVAAVEGLHEAGARLADGSRVDVDDIVLATGFGTGLEPLVGHLGVLGERGMPRVTDGGEAAPGLRFVGYVYRPGLTGYVGRLARRAAREIAAADSRVLSGV